MTSPKEPDYADLDVPEWLSDWADDVCYKAPYPDHGYAPTQRVTGYVRWLEARVFVDYDDNDEELAMANARLLDAEKALRSIAQYDPRWKGQRVNDMPSRAELIARAYDALAPLIDPS